jgi:hypothetical protein
VRGDRGGEPTVERTSYGGDGDLEGYKLVHPYPSTESDHLQTDPALNSRVQLSILSTLFSHQTTTSLAQRSPAKQRSPQLVHCHWVKGGASFTVLWQHGWFMHELLGIVQPLAGHMPQLIPHPSSPHCFPEHEEGIWLL